MHDEIRKFSLDGTLRETDIVKTKERLVDYVESLMRDYNYVPALDLEPQFTLDYSPVDQGYKFALTCYGVKVDKENVWETGGIMGGKPIMKSIPKNKSKQLQISVG
jgi:hypothetical protein